MKYISDRDISFSLDVGGTGRRVTFLPSAKGGSMHVTSDPAEIKALEASRMFGRVYRRDPSQPAPPPAGKAVKAQKKAAAPPLKAVAGIGSWQAAIDYLADTFGSPREELSSPEAILREAVGQGVAFPDLETRQANGKVRG